MFPLKFLLVSLCVFAFANKSQAAKKCPPILSTRHLQATCTLNGIKLGNCSEPAAEGTIVKYQCSTYLQVESTIQTQTCRDGSWDGLAPPKCAPTCGQKSVDILGGTMHKPEYPWQVAIYKNQRFICSGVLLNPRTILTAATCFEGSTKPIPKTSYSVAVGKYYRKYDDQRDQNPQFSKVEDVFIPPEYHGDANNYFADIALVIAAKNFTLSNKVQPVCLDWLRYMDPDTLQNGYVSGWGFADNSSTLPEELKELKVSIIDNIQCYAKVNKDMTKYVTPDKFCTGNMDLNDSGKYVGRGDSGGGLVVERDGTYYVVGILGICAQNNHEVNYCDDLVLYTKISPYINFIQSKMK